MEAYKTQVLLSQEDGAIEEAVERLIAGELVAVPTETVYGLAANALNETSVAKIFAVKGRPSHNPLICHVADIAMAERYVHVSEPAKILMQHYWPGPLTVVLPKRDDCQIADAASAGLKTLAVRSPDNAATLRLIAALDRAIAAPSANPSGKLSPTCAADVLAGLGGKIPLILDGGSTSIGIESTIISVTGTHITLLRPGTILADDISETSGLPVFDRDNETITAPGQLTSHYAPNTTIRLNATASKDGEYHIGFGEIEGDLSLSASGDLTEAAHNLFTVMRVADAKQATCIAVAPIPNKGIGFAINDRLLRAAAPRDGKNV